MMAVAPSPARPASRTGADLAVSIKHVSMVYTVKGGGHDLARTHADEVAPLIERHLSD